MTRHTILLLFMMLPVWCASVNSSLAHNIPASKLSGSTENMVREFTDDVGAEVLKAQGFMLENKPRSAMPILTNLLNLEDLNAYEHSLIHQMLGMVHYDVNDIDNTIMQFEAAISAGGLFPREVKPMRWNIAQLLVNDGQYAAGAQMIEGIYEKEGELTYRQVETLMQALVESGAYERALPWAEKWFADARTLKREHFNVLFLIYSQLDLRDKKRDVLRQMKARWPDDATLDDI